MSKALVILFGGSSSERLVSVASAQNVATLLPEAQLWFLSKSGAVHLPARETVLGHQRPFENEFDPRVPAVAKSMDEALDRPEAANTTFFLALHGGEGENGTLQAKFEKRRIAFTGSGAAASARAFDKAVTKELLAHKGARLAKAELFEPMTAQALQPKLRALFERASRWVLKPVADGSSVGLVHFTSAAQAGTAAQTVSQLGLRYLAEEFISGRELTVGVVEAPTGVSALPVSEVRTSTDGGFDYQGKYLGRGTEELTPAPITEAERTAAQALAVLAHSTVGCRGYSRTDMILTSDGPVFLEINTLPGLTKASFIPQQLAAAGRDLTMFLREQLQLAERRSTET